MGAGYPYCLALSWCFLCNSLADIFVVFCALIVSTRFAHSLALTAPKKICVQARRKTWAQRTRRGQVESSSKVESTKGVLGEGPKCTRKVKVRFG